jgi:translation initiation factor 2 subunit 2
LDDEEYLRLLDRAISQMPTLSQGRGDFVIPKVEAITQGSKTIVSNILAVAEKARRKPEEIAKYLSRELGVPTGIEGQRLMINGKFKNEELDNKVTRYFEIYVVCRECHKPDSHIESAGRGMLYFVCEACGARYGVKSY